MRLPKVSICVPSYNGEKYIGEAIASVLNQTLQDFELIVVDDFSADGSVSIVETFRDPRIRIVKNSSRLGLVDNWNKCIELSRGEYLYIFHQDDVMLPANLERKLSFLNQNPQVGLVFSQANVIDAGGKFMRAYTDRLPNQDLVQDGLTFVGQWFEAPNVVCCPTVIVKKECYEKLGGFDARLPFTCDWEMWMRICLNYDVGYICEPLLNHREHENSESVNFFDHTSNLRQNFRARTVLLDKFPGRIPNHKELRAKIQRDYSERALSLANHHYSHQRYDIAKALLRFSSEAYRPIVKNERFLRLSAKLLLGERPTRWVSDAKAILQR